MTDGEVKQRIVETVQQLPETATIEDAMEQLYFLAKLERGIEQSKRGETLSHDDVKQRFAR